MSAPLSISYSDTQTERLVLSLRERILKGEFPRGEQLTELGLVSLLQVSRTPIRLALERLANEGLLDPIPTGGFRVRSFSLVDIWDAIEIRGVLEGTAGRFAAERLGTVDELAGVKRLLAKATMEFPITAEGFARYLDVNRSFHRELWWMAKSPPCSGSWNTSARFLSPRLKPWSSALRTVSRARPMSPPSNIARL